MPHPCPMKHQVHILELNISLNSFHIVISYCMIAIEISFDKKTDLMRKHFTTFYTVGFFY